MNMAVSKNDTHVIWYNIGRLTRVLTDFNPIEMETPSDSWYYDQQDELRDPSTESSTESSQSVQASQR